MPLEIQVPFDQTSIELEEYVDLIKSNKYDFSSQDDIIDSAKYLNQLNNNKGLLINSMCEQLKEIDTFQQFNSYGPQVFIIFGSKKYFLRMVAWNTLSKVELSIENFKYDMCHDHNFDLLTIGHFGPGYDSRCYTYEYDQIMGLIGEEVDMQDERIYTLSEGKIFLYRAKKDIHIQLPPKNLSVSLNMIPRNPRLFRPQYEFDESKHCIARYIQVAETELIVKIAGLSGSVNAIEPLYSILKTHPSPHVKAFSALSIIQISPNLLDDVTEKVNESNDKLVKRLFKKMALC